ncbi:MAG: phenylalanine--tRNA ligase subunit alpha [Lentisphaerae bacterium RIFOXYC12_FULL_60_16]|nr:MAG: phenylalanine--tRNA ligase subunit alpha [Lentisphaerae bacterium RIFOXYC12_FULL_60_16]OGV86059.1 MAG: phenylalanine--tRNA ligase subunit alpha [Lentisphaerae bacterium RIFOXYB12_FULL_60_10]
MTLNEIIEARDRAFQEAEAATDAAALEAVRVRYLGRKGQLPQIMACLRELPPEQRGEAGRLANEFKQGLVERLDNRKPQDTTAAAASGFDYTLPGTGCKPGTVHPVSRVIADVIRIFGRLGFTVADGPDIETRYHNFEALNTPAHHPSLDAKDTFWLDGGGLLRTQTSPVQIRVMERQSPPVRIITPGRCYRRDTTDATHSANFHQVEGLYVDRRVSLADLKGTLACFMREMMGPSVAVRFRPHFFPFTEPSVECDFSCHLCGGSGCRVCKHSGWIEIAGAGMVDPRVFRKVGYDPEVFSGYAFGMGVERIAMIQYGIEDIRMLYENDVRFLEQFR